MSKSFKLELLIISRNVRKIVRKILIALQVFPAIRRFTEHGAEFVDGRSEDFDAVVLATGYRSNVPSWLMVFFFFFLR